MVKIDRQLNWRRERRSVSFGEFGCTAPVRAKREI
jgi:hypothetical protein